MKVGYNEKHELIVYDQYRISTPNSGRVYLKDNHLLKCQLRMFANKYVDLEKF